MIAAGLVLEPSEFESDGFPLEYEQAIESLPATCDWPQLDVCVVPVVASFDERSSGEPIDSRAGSLMDKPYMVSFLPANEMVRMAITRSPATVKGWCARRSPEEKP